MPFVIPDGQVLQDTLMGDLFNNLGNHFIPAFKS